MAFVRNCWYAAGWENEFTDRPIARTLLGEPLVMFRGQHEEVAVLVDRCPHRGVPLSMGSVVGGNVRCIYHALEFDSTGVCVRNPHIAGSPGRLSTRKIPSVTRHGVVWIWHGDENRCDPSGIPDYSWLGLANYTVIHGIMSVQANFRLVVDNLLDLSHAEYLHAKTVGTPGSSSSVKTSVSVGENQLTVHRKVFDLPPSAVFAPAWKRTERIDQYSDMSWFAPSNLKLDLGITPPGGEKEEGLHFPSAHLLTPEKEHSTHYFYAVARNFSQSDGVLSERLRHTFLQAFEGEDRPVIEAVQRRLDDMADGFSFASFTPGDSASARARKMIDKLLAPVAS